MEGRVIIKNKTFSGYALERFIFNNSLLLGLYPLHKDLIVGL